MAILSNWTVMLAIAVMAGLLLAGRDSENHAVDAEDASLPGEADIFRDGRLASSDTPPARSRAHWLLRIYAAISEHRLVALAAGMTFYSLLAIFPALAALVAIYSLFADPSTIAGHVDYLSGFLPGGALDVARDQLTRVASKGRQTLGWTFLIGLAISLWSANAAMKSLFDTLNIIYGEREGRGFFKLNTVSLMFTLGGIVFVQLAIAAVVILPVALNYVGLSDRADLLLRAGRWPGLLVALTVSLSFIYRFGPDRRTARWRWVSWGSVTAAMLWLAASAAFSWYAANFGAYNETYGSLGAVIGFMTWLWISAIAVLVGAEVDAAMELG
ncbi:YihY/virulence factor BrkB family protein [Bradyrhizobium sp. Tv2a-2]|uniref:YihY/virulence factor BrkB family protein n=1 Tax=Bradyrhizobium sp. Tv2a-2 TaxID=113395 RepID=UPI0004171C5D|nr:YihY/virulence factor BrkB family protein [Bradyrhizobium sp. Tv2a-2]